MKKLTALTVSFAFLLVVSFAYSQGAGAPPAQTPSTQAPPAQTPPAQTPPAQRPPAQAPAAAEKVFEGQLTKVDATAKSISVKGTEGPDMVFTYTDQTQMVGPDQTIQGLAGKPGAKLKVSYREAGTTKTATKIEQVVEAR